MGLPLLGADPEAFPPVDTALTRPNGLLAAGGDLSTERLVAAYRRGIFPWFSPGEPILWWSPDPRLVLRPEAFRLTRSLRKRVRAAGWRITCDSAFLPVIHACATTPRPGQSGTWIVPEMVTAYTRLHRLGIAHSVEVWDGGRLVGGLYGVSLGAAFFGELATKMDKKPRLFNRQKAIMGAQEAWTCTSAALSADTGYAPQVGYKQGVERALAWYRKEKWL